jgi:hypothetical protein
VIERRANRNTDRSISIKAGVYQLCDVFRPTDPLGPAVAEAKEKTKQQQEGIVPLAECRVV